MQGIVKELSEPGEPLVGQPPAVGGARWRVSVIFAYANILMQLFCNTSQALGFFVAVLFYFFF